MAINLSLGYPKKILYKDVALDFPNNGIISFIGQNGSGKSTLYKTLLGIIPPIKGSIPNDLIQNIGIISDYIYMPKEVKVKDMCNLVDKQNMHYSKEKYPSFHKYILSIWDSKIKNLSSGQRKIAEIYVVLLTGKDIIILDEATNTLDVTNRNLFLKTVKELSSNILFLHTSHDLEDVTYLGGEIFGLLKEKGEISRYNGKYDVQKIREFLGYEVLK